MENQDVKLQLNESENQIKYSTFSSNCSCTSVRRRAEPPQIYLYFYKITTALHYMLFQFMQFPTISTHP